MSASTDITLILHRDTKSDTYYHSLLGGSSRLTIACGQWVDSKVGYRPAKVALTLSLFDGVVEWAEAVTLSKNGRTIYMDENGEESKAWLPPQVVEVFMGELFDDFRRESQLIGMDRPLDRWRFRVRVHDIYDPARVEPPKPSEESYFDAYRRILHGYDALKEQHSKVSSELATVRSMLKEQTVRAEGFQKTLQTVRKQHDQAIRLLVELGNDGADIAKRVDGFVQAGE